jgi:predicted enzyme related to lactoylglutathione lyase
VVSPFVPWARVDDVTVTIQCLVIDCADPQALASFWEAALGWRRTHDTPSEVALEPAEHSMEDGVVPDLLFVRVPGDRAGKNRLHLDLRPDDQEAEVARLESLGAVRTSVGQGDDVGWVVMADPELNEFCVLSPLTLEQSAEVARIRSARHP